MKYLSRGLVSLIVAAGWVHGQAADDTKYDEKTHDGSSEVKRINAATEAFGDMMNAKDGGIPQDILERSQCLAIIPSMKRAAFIFGGKYGRGVVTCRVAGGNKWSAPSMIVVEGGSFGLQLGGGETDVIMAVMNRSGEEKLTRDKFTLGGDASVMAGPVGRDAAAQTDAWMKAEILSWSRARGVFAGISLEGASMRPDREANRALYGKDVGQEAILHGSVRAPVAARALLTRLSTYAPRTPTGD